MRPVITLEMLRKHDACDAQCELFEVTFGREAELTKENFDLARKIGMGVAWLRCLLSPASITAYTKDLQASADRCAENRRNAWLSIEDKVEARAAQDDFYRQHIQERCDLLFSALIKESSLYV